MWLLKKSAKASSRKQIAIKEVMDGILILPHNHYRLVLECSSVNFELKSEAEQDVLIDSFQGFLNSLTTPLQIVTRTREVDVDQYVEGVMGLQKNESQPIYREQIKNYCSFVKQLVSGSKVLSRKFYLIIPFEPEDQADFSLVKEQLNFSKDLVVKALEKLGIKTKELTSLEVLDLFYTFYNPTHTKTQALTQAAIESVLRESHV